MRYILLLILLVFAPIQDLDDPVGDWYASESKDPIDDSVTERVMALTVDEGSDAKNIFAFLCFDGIPIATIQYPGIIRGDADGNASVDVRVDDRDALRDLPALVAPGNDGVILRRTEARAIQRELEAPGAAQLLVRIHDPAATGYKDFRFKVGGFPEAAKRLTSCSFE